MKNLRYILLSALAALFLLGTMPADTSAAPDRSQRVEQGSKKGERSSKSEARKSSKKKSSEKASSRSKKSKDRVDKPSERSSRKSAEKRSRKRDGSYSYTRRSKSSEKNREVAQRRQSTPYRSAFIPEVPAPRTFRRDGYRGDLCPTVETLGNEVVDIARTYMGTPYRSGGTTPNGFDCSGFVQWVFKRYGVNVPRSTYEQLETGHKVEKNRLLPGDILVFRSSQARSGLHSGIYIGNDRFIHSPRTGDRVKTSRVSDGYFSNRLIAARRVLKAPPCDIELYAKPNIYRSHELLEEEPSFAHRQR